MKLHTLNDENPIIRTLFISAGPRVCLHAVLWICMGFHMCMYMYIVLVFNTYMHAGLIFKTIFYVL